MEKAKDTERIERVESRLKERGIGCGGGGDGGRAGGVGDKDAGRTNRKKEELMLRIKMKKE